MFKWLESDKYTKSPYKFICKLDQAIKELSEAIFEQKVQKERLAAVAKVIKVASLLLASDINAHQDLLCEAIKDEKRDEKRNGLINASARNTAVAMTAMACAKAALQYDKEFCDLLKNYKNASSVARGKDDFKDMKYYGHMGRFSIYRELISNNLTTEDSGKVANLEL